MWLHPWLGLPVVSLIIGAFVVMVRSADHRQEVVATLASCAALALLGCGHQRRSRARS